MRAVVAGCGLIANRWIRTLLADGRIDVVALTDPNAASARDLANRHHLAVSVCSRLADAIVHHSPDVLINLSPPGHHAEVSLQALRAGLHVLSEKPLAVSSREACQLVEVARDRGVQLRVMQNRGLDERWLGLVDAVREYDTGPLQIEVDVAVDLPYPGFRAGLLNAVTLDLAVHAFDQARQLIRAPALDVLAEESALPFLADHCSIATIVVRFADGSVVSYRGGYVAGPGPRSSADGRWRIRGTGVYATWNGESDTALFAADAEPVSVTTAPPAVPSYVTCLTKMIDNLTGTRAEYPAAQSSLGSVALLEAAVRSISTGGRTDVKAVAV